MKKASDQDEQMYEWSSFRYRREMSQSKAVNFDSIPAADINKRSESKKRGKAVNSKYKS